jgi:predicted RNA-binding Zn-ribbon protein involved in translation (DUF1610 family)
MAELENDEVNRQLCAVAADEMFDSWSPETQEQILAEWNDWRRDENPGHSCSHCGKTFTRLDNLKRHVKRVHTGERAFTCDQCGKTFATKDMLKRHKKMRTKEKTFECARCHKRFARKVCICERVLSLLLSGAYIIGMGIKWWVILNNA